MQSLRRTPGSSAVSRSHYSEAECARRAKCRLAFGVTRLVKQRDAYPLRYGALLIVYCDWFGRRSCSVRCMISPMLKPLQSWALSAGLSSASVSALATVRKHWVQIESNVPFGLRRCGKSGRDDRNMVYLSYASEAFIRLFAHSLLQLIRKLVIPAHCCPEPQLGRGR